MYAVALSAGANSRAGPGAVRLGRHEHHLHLLASPRRWAVQRLSRVVLLGRRPRGQCCRLVLRHVFLRKRGRLHSRLMGYEQPQLPSELAATRRSHGHACGVLDVFERGVPGILRERCAGILDGGAHCGLGRRGVDWSCVYLSPQAPHLQPTCTLKVTRAVLSIGGGCAVEGDPTCS